MCNEGIEVVLFGANYPGEAPRQVLMGPTFCTKCLKKIEDLDGIALVEGTMVETQRGYYSPVVKQPRVTGRLWVIRRDAAIRVFGEEMIGLAMAQKRIALISPEAVDKLDLATQKGSLDEN
jgi:hypothetical protein